MKSDFNSPGDAALSRTLADLAPGREAVVVDVDPGCATARRLLDLGLLPETRVRVLRRAPFGDPTVYELRGYRLCLRGADAARVRVRVVDPEPTRPPHDPEEPGSP